MIKSLRLERFRSHYDYTFKFCSGINGIIGVSQSGKTNVLRALRWLLTNRPLSTRVKSDFSKVKTFVTTELDSGLKARIGRGSTGSSSYSLTLPSGDKTTWNSVGSSVPDLVVEKLNFSELNIQEQLDTPFLMTSSGGEVARTISRITKADKLDAWIKKLSSKIKMMNHERDSVAVDLKETRKELQRFKRLDEAKKAITTIEKVQSKLKSLDYEHTEISDILANIKDAENSIATQSRLLRSKKYIDQIEAIEKEKVSLQLEKEKIEYYTTTEMSIKTIQAEKLSLAARYSTVLKALQICPTCFHKLSRSDILRINREILTTK